MSGEQTQLYESVYQFISKVSRNGKYSAFASLPDKQSQFGKAFYAAFEVPKSLCTIRMKIYKHSFKQLTEVIDELKEVITNFKSLYDKKSQEYETLEQLHEEIDKFIEDNDLMKILNSQAKGKSKQFMASMKRFIKQKEEEEQKRQSKLKSKVNKASRKAKGSKRVQEFRPFVSQKNLGQAGMLAKQLGQDIAKMMKIFEGAIQNGDIKGMIKDVNNLGKKVLHKRQLDDEFIFRFHYTGFNDQQYKKFFDYAEDMDDEAKEQMNSDD